ncbi:MAG TPA: DUF4091 domain-containing protein [Armatimonadota bacterium]|nr:DUF4091 domain-containing protein [Armatimonadota bacterium]
MLTHLCILIATGAAPAAPSLVTNGDFEKDLAGWSLAHTWYEKPAGGGLSEAIVVDGEGRDGGKALRITGGGKRGLAMQAPVAYPGRYRVTGWLKCEGLEAGQAGVLAEWMDGKGTWLRGDWAAAVTGTRDWQAFDTTVEAPATTRSVHIDLITTEPNDGTVWFDDITFERIASNLLKPNPPVIAAETPEGAEGCLKVTWDPASLEDGVIRLVLYCVQRGDDGEQALPRGVADAESGEATIWSLANGEYYDVSAVAVNGDDVVSERGEAVRTRVSDRQPPRAGFVEARWLGRSRVSLSWSPHPLDFDLEAIRIVAPGAAEGELVALESLDAKQIAREARPFYCTAPWAEVDVELPAGQTRVGVQTEDAAGNASPVAWVEPLPVRPADAGPVPCALWTEPPTAQLARSAEPPAVPSASFELELMGGQAKGFQVAIRPQADLHDVRVVFEPLAREGGGTIGPRWIAAHFVAYCNLERNSIATPADELVWKAPGDFPDELSDAPAMDLPAGQTQPVYIRVTAPSGSEPGVYSGRGYVDCAEGRSAFDIRVQIADASLPARPRLKFVYWFGWGEPCKQFGVEQSSEDGWRVLARLGQLMKAHHQNTAVVSYGLVRSWRMPDGSLAHDFADFDRFVRTMQEQGVDELFCIGHMGSRTTGEWECPTMSSHGYTITRADTGASEQIDVLELLPALQAHIEDIGLLDRFCVHVADEPIPQNLESYKQLSARVHAAAPKLRRIDAIHVPDLQGSLEIWVPQLNYFEQWLDPYRAAQAAGNELWFYIAWVPQGKYPNRMIDSAAIKPRVLHWLNALYDTTGYLHWALNWWDISLMSLNSPGDQYITWPSERFVANSSLRYEAEREGLEDCELMFMLRDALEKTLGSREQAQAEMEAMGRKAVRSIQDYTRDWRELEATRQEILRRLEDSRG